jgi:hypothetical protein
VRRALLCFTLVAAGCFFHNSVENRVPNSVTGPETSVFSGSEVTLSGAASSDPEGDPLTYRWRQRSGVPVHLKDPSAVMTTFEAPHVAQPTALVFELRVSDGTLSSTASTTVTVKPASPDNHSPVARITAPHEVQPPLQVELDGSASSDEDLDPLEYEWTQTSGPHVSLKAAGAKARVDVPETFGADVGYGFALKVSDGRGGQARTEVTLTAHGTTTNRPPVASAGRSFDVAAGERVTLHGSATDPDGDAIAAWHWEQTKGPALQLSSSTAASPVFTAPRTSSAVTLSFSLIATDARGTASAPSQVNVYVSPGPVVAAALTKVVSLHAVTRSSIVLFFETDVPVVASVDFGTRAITEHTQSERVPETRHVITLDHLTPDTRYVYAVRAGTAAEEGSFMTAVDFAAAPRPFSFAVVGDTRDHAVWKEVARAMLAKHPRFMLHTGDAIDSWGGAAGWADYYASAAELFAQVPVFATEGNHDTGPSYPLYNPAPRSSSGSSFFYAFVYGNAGFVAIDTSDTSPEETAFVQTALTRMRGGPLFAFHHHPLYSCGSHRGEAELQSTYQRMFEQAHLTVDFAGHDHALVIWEPVNGVRYLVSGGGGARLYPLQGCRGPYAQSKHGFVMVDVDGKTVRETVYDAGGVELYSSGPFQASGPAPDFSALRDLVSY